jgi:Mg2+/Co2+ transporter CorC
MQIEQFNREFRQHLPEDVVETIGGLVLDRFGELPVVGANVLIDGLEFVVETVEGNRIMMLSVKAVRDTVSDDPAAAGELTPGGGRETAVPASGTSAAEPDED